MTCKECLHNKVCPHLKDTDADRCKIYADKDEYVNVVRCKDCKHKNPHCNKCLRDNLWHDADDFCSYGVKK